MSKHIENDRCMILTTQQLEAAAERGAEAISKGKHLVVMGGAVTAISLYCTGCASSQALNPGTKPQRLAELSRHQEWKICRDVAANPNTPLETVVKLCAHDNQEVASSAAANLAIRKMAVAEQEELAGHPDAFVRCSLAYNRGTASKILEQLSRDSNIFVLQNVVGNPSAPIAVLLTACPQTGCSSELAEKRLIHWAQAEVVNPTKLETLSRHMLLPVRVGVAANAHTTMKALITLIQDSHASVRDSLVAHTSYRNLQALIGMEDVKIRKNVAGSSKAPSSALKRLAQDSNSTVRRTVAENPGVTSAILTLLTQDEDATVRKSTAANTRTPENCLLRLAEDKAIDVRVAVMKNPTATPAVLVGLSDDKDGSIRKALAENSRTPEKALLRLAEDQSVSVRRAVTRRSSTTAAILNSLADDKDIEIRKLLAANTKVPVEILKKLGGDTNTQVRLALAGNPHTPSETLERLSRAGRSEVLMALAKRSGLSETCLKNLLCRALIGDAILKKNTTASLTKIMKVNTKKLFEKKTDSELLASLVKHHASVRWAVKASMPASPQKSFGGQQFGCRVCTRGCTSGCTVCTSGCTIGCTFGCTGGCTSGCTGVTNCGYAGTAY